MAGFLYQNSSPSNLLLESLGAVQHQGQGQCTLFKTLGKLLSSIISLVAAVKFTSGGVQVLFLERS